MILSEADSKYRTETLIFSSICSLHIINAIYVCCRNMPCIHVKTRCDLSTRCSYRGSVARTVEQWTSNPMVGLLATDFFLG